MYALLYHFFTSPAWQAIKQYSVLSLAGCLFQRASERCIINVTVRFNRQRARKATGVVSSPGKGPDKAVNCAIWISSTLNFAKTMQYSWPMIPRACARPYCIIYTYIYIYTYFSTLKTPSENACHWSSHKKLFAFYETFVQFIFKHYKMHY